MMNSRARMLTLVGALLASTACRRAPSNAGDGSSVPKKVGPAAGSASAVAATPPATAGCPIFVAAQPGDALPRIQGALDQAANGDCAEVLLGAGTFELSAPVQLRSGVRLTGQRFKRSFSTIRPSPDFKGSALLLTKFVDVQTKERKQTEFYLQSLRLDARPPCPTKEQCAPANVEVGLWLEYVAYPTIRDCEFSRFPESGAGIRGGGVLYLKLKDSRFLGMRGWSVDLALQHAPKKPSSEKAYTYYAVSVGIIEGNYFSTRRGIRLTPGYAVTIRDNQFEGGLSMIHAYESASSVLNIESNYFEVSSTPEDIPERGTIAIKGTGRVVGNLMYGPAKGKNPHYHGPGIEVMGGGTESSTSINVEDNTVRRFDPGVRVNGITDPSFVRDRGNLIAPKKHVEMPWDFPARRPVPGPEQPSEDASELPPE